MLLETQEPIDAVRRDVELGHGSRHSVAAEVLRGKATKRGLSGDVPPQEGHSTNDFWAHLRIGATQTTTRDDA